MNASDGEEHAEEPITRLCAELGLPETMPHLRQALTHPSFANEHPEGSSLDNQRLEFLGDAVLGLCVSELLMARFTQVDEGALTLMRASLVNTDALADAARRLGISNALRLGRGAEAAGEGGRTNVLADALEALVGAVYLDCGLDKGREVSFTIVGRRLEKLVARGGIERDAKSRLQELVQANGADPPRYEVVTVEGPAHARRFSVQVEVDWAEALGEASQVKQRFTGQGEGRSKKLAEQEAARAALSALEAFGRS